MRETFIRRGVPADDADVVADVLIAADLMGIDTHGVNRLKYYHDRLASGVTQPRTRFEVVNETETTGVVDGHHGLGHVVGVKAMRLAIEKAARHGIGAVAVRNSTHYGIAGYYPLLAVDRGMAGLTTSNARPCMAPTFGVEPMYGTNPIAFGAPTDEELPFLFDASVAIAQRGKLEVLNRKGEPAPDGWAIDQQGDFVHDVPTILRGMLGGDVSLLPLGGAGEEHGGHKGYGLAVMLEILCSAFQDGAFLKDLAGGDTTGKPEPYRVGHFFLAMNIESFVPLESFRRTTGRIMRELRASRKAPGRDRIWTAGEQEWEARQKREKEGIPLLPDLRRELIALRDELGMESGTYQL